MQTVTEAQIAQLEQYVTRMQRAHLYPYDVLSRLLQERRRLRRAVAHFLDTISRPGEALATPAVARAIGGLAIALGPNAVEVRNDTT